jgi:WD40 repeat protein
VAVGRFNSKGAGIDICDATTGKLDRTLCDRFVDHLVYSASGRHLLGVKADQYAILLDADSGALSAEWELKKGTWLSSAVSPDGRYVASGDEDGTLHLWDGVGGRELARWHAYEAGVTALTFCPEGNPLLSGGGDGALKLWDLPFLRKELAALGLEW